MMLRLLLLVAYPLLVHLSVVRASATLAGLCLPLLAAVMLYAPLARRERGAWLGFALVVVLSAGLIRYGGAIAVLYLPPLLLPLAALVGFAGSLLPGRTPLVSQIAAQVHGPLPAPLARYTRGVTWLWALTIGALLAANLGMTTFGSRDAWSRFTNGGDYLTLGIVFFGEYAVRRLRFRDLPQPPFLDYLRLVVRTRPGAT